MRETVLGVNKVFLVWSMFYTGVADARPILMSAEPRIFLCFPVQAWRAPDLTLASPRVMTF